MPASRPKVLVAMSGGVDSSVAAALLLRAGFDVVGCFMRLGSPGETLDEPMLDSGGGGGACRLNARTAAPGDRPLKIGHQGCCSITDAADARLVAAELGIPFYVCNFKKDFGRIIDYFVDEYAAGRTPNPCVRCNDWLKFGKLHDYARQIGAEFVASGHYARVEPSPLCSQRSAEANGDRDGEQWGGAGGKRGAGGEGGRLLRGIDRDKDQSYVLFGVPRHLLGRMLLPIGALHKAEVRDLAKRFGLPVFDKPDSQEICFVPDNDYAGLVERRRPDVARSGPILDPQGRQIGTHGGQHRFTIGQRRGVGVALGYPIFVVRKDPAANTVTVGPREMLLAQSCTALEANWLVGPPPADRWTPVLAKYRYNAEAVPASVRPMPDHAGPTPSGRSGAFEVRFDQPQQAVAPGQAIVLYGHPGHGDSDVVLGGGWIASAS